MSSDPAAPEREGREHIPLHIRITHQTKVLNMPTPASPVAGADVETQLRLLCHPNAEVLDDKDRIDRFVRWGSEAAAEIARLRAEVAELRKPDLRTVLGFEAGQQHERATQADELTALRARVAGLEGTLAYYAHPMNWNSGDVPGHTYAHDDGGAQAREALGLPARVPAPKEWETGVLCSEIALSSINDPRDARIAELEAAPRPQTAAAPQRWAAEREGQGRG